MSHNLKTVETNQECDRVRVTSYCGPRDGDTDRSRLELSQNNVKGQVLSSVHMKLTKQQARDLATTLLAWSDNV